MNYIKDIETLLNNLKNIREKYAISPSFHADLLQALLGKVDTAFGELDSEKGGFYNVTKWSKVIHEGSDEQHQFIFTNLPDEMPDQPLVEIINIQDGSYQYTGILVVSCVVSTWHYYILWGTDLYTASTNTPVVDPYDVFWETIDLTHREKVNAYQPNLRTDNKEVVNALNELYDKISAYNNFSVHFCTSDEYDPDTRIPTIANPSTSTCYIVPNIESGTGVIFTGWRYVDNTWVTFGSANMDISGLQPKTDNSLQTTSKEVVGAINEVNAAKIDFWVATGRLSNDGYFLGGFLKNGDSEQTYTTEQFIDYLNNDSNNSYKPVFLHSRITPLSTHFIFTLSYRAENDYIFTNTLGSDSGYFQIYQLRLTTAGDGNRYFHLDQLSSLEFEGIFRYDTLPTAVEGLLGKIIQYTGNTYVDATSGDIIQGRFYKCVAGTESGTYKWEERPLGTDVDMSLTDADVQAFIGGTPIDDMNVQESDIDTFIDELN